MIYLPVMVMLVLGQVVGWLAGWLSVWVQQKGFPYAPFVEPGVWLLYEWIFLALIYWFSDRWMPRMFGGKPVDERSAPELVAMVRSLCLRANLPQPKVYLLRTPMLNAFAAGRDPEHASVSVTTGDLKHLDRRQLAGVLGHELAHVANRDLLIGTILGMALATIWRFWPVVYSYVRVPWQGGLLAMWLFLIGGQSAFSWWRELRADRDGARICGDPTALASALERIASAMGAHRWLPSRSHPPVGLRVERLRRMERETVSGAAIPNIIS